jgi:hypothetical protein
MQTTGKSLKLLNRLRTLMLATVAVLIVLAVLVGANLAGCLKAVSIVQGAPIPVLAATGPVLDAQSLVRRIPYSRHPEKVLSFDPAERYQATMLRGQGDCGDMAKGLAYQLSRQGIDYQEIHFLPKRNLLKGWGHTILRVPLQIGSERKTALLDIYEGGILERQGRLIDVQDLATAKPGSVSIHRLAPLRWEKEFNRYDELLKDHHLGYTPASHMRNYLQWSRRIYLPLGNQKLEYGLYSLALLLLDQHRSIYTASVAAAMEPVDFQMRTFWLLCLQLLRFGLVLLGALTTLYAWLALSIRWKAKGVDNVGDRGVIEAGKRRSKTSHSATQEPVSRI